MSQNQYQIDILRKQGISFRLYLFPPPQGLPKQNTRYSRASCCPAIIKFLFDGVEIEVLTVVVTKKFIFRAIKPCSPVKVN
jgi:hypothetical protein